MNEILFLDLADEAATSALGTRLAPVLRSGDLLLLSGDLGAGKSVLARAIIQYFYPGAPAPSPTFTFVETYDEGPLTISHFDLYRLEAPEDVWELGIEEAMDEGLMIVEWPERTGALPTGTSLQVRFEITDKGAARRAILSGDANWARRLGEMR